MSVSYFEAVVAHPIPGIRWSTQKWIILSCCLVSCWVPTSSWPLGSLFNFWPGQRIDRSSQENFQTLQNGSPRVLNFFPVPVEEECTSEDRRRRGICMNTYECRIQHGKSHGPCALGFGVCCLFTTSCGEEVQNNLTYVISPGFPNLIDRPMNCTVLVKKIDRQVSQLRIDFLHFNIGQPNRRTGVCDEDAMEIRNGRSALRLCGWNSGQHVYIDVNEDDEPIVLDFRLPSSLQSRIWEMRVIQLGFEQRAPAGCLQYFATANGTLRTFNYLPNGRYLANNDYLLCVRQERGMCGISYSPCTPDSFKIGPPRLGNFVDRNGTAANGISGVNESSNNGGNPSILPGAEIGGEGSGAGPPEQEIVSPSSTFSPSIMDSLRRRCRDRVLIPCDFEEFIMPGNEGAGICNLEHCGNSLCGRNEFDTEGNCRVETWATPFRIRVAFGPGQDTGTSLEDNIGMCLTYEQLPCLP